MAFNLASITNETRLRAPRIILLGVEKIGKSSFAAGSDRPIFIPVRGEEGIDGIAVPQYPTCKTFDDVMSCLYSLYTEKHEFGTSVIDSSSTLQPIIFEEICRKNGNVDSIEKACGGYGKGYVEALSYWRRITEALDALRNDRGMASIIIGHVTVKRFDDPCGESYDQYQFDLHDGKSSSAVQLLFRWADVILFCNTKVIVRKEEVGFKGEKHQGVDIGNGARFLYTQKRPAHPGGGRGVYGRLPYELPLNFGSFMDAVQAASKQ
jgi:hypothetical protein